MSVTSQVRCLDPTGRLAVFRVEPDGGPADPNKGLGWPTGQPPTGASAGIRSAAADTAVLVGCVDADR
jgi:hypothetical protein